MSRLSDTYKDKVTLALKDEFKYRSVMQVPKLCKVVLNMGLGENTQNPKAMEYAEFALATIAGQKPIVRRSKKSIASFKLKANYPVGCMVTLRGERMYEFLDRLIAIALPRVKDFRGVSPKGFDGRGNFSMGIREQIVFPELNMEQLDRVRGMNVTFVTTAKNDTESRALLEKLGMPFRKK